MKNYDEPTKLQILVAEITGKAESEYWGVTKQMPVRVRLDLFAKISALHEFANEKKKVPRNQLLNDLLDIAVEQVMSELDEDTVFLLNQMASRHYDLITIEVSDLSDDEVSK
jgi:hypothetical protein